jgi:magnesium chelatase subunit I
VAAFDDARVIYAGDDLPATTYSEVLAQIPALEPPVLALAGSETPAAVASAVEFILEGLHLTKRLNKEAAGAKATYRGRG